MKIKAMNDQQILQEWLTTLLESIEPSKVMHFFAACQLGEGDYLKLKDKLFESETVASLYEKIKTYQEDYN
jgi:hypothetical protein